LNWLNQIAALTSFNVRTVRQRLGSSTSAIFGIAGVVGVLIGVLSISQGFRRAMTVSGKADTAVVMRSGSDTEMSSILNGDEARIVADVEGIARTDGVSLASSELFVIINMPKRSTGTDANVPLRGVERPAFDVRGDFKIVKGRLFEWGKNEVVAGVGASNEFSGLDLGSTIPVGKQKWEVVGLFSANGGIAESEIWTDARVLQPAYQRGNTVQAVYARLDSAEHFQEFKDRLTTDPRLNVKVVRQTDYYAEQSTVITRLITTVGTLVAGLMGVGAVFGALNTMYSAVSSRTREIATLRALGFGSSAVILSVLLEALLLAAIGSLTARIAGKSPPMRPIPAA
jgi:putative ABC transport system permease protein